MMKKLLITTILTILPLLSIQAHYLWLETNKDGKLGKKHEIRVHYGEYTYGVFEQVEGEAFPLVSKLLRMGPKRRWIPRPKKTIIWLISHRPKMGSIPWH